MVGDPRRPSDDYGQQNNMPNLEKFVSVKNPFATELCIPTGTYFSPDLCSDVHIIIIIIHIIMLTVYHVPISPQNVNCVKQ